MRVEPRKHRHKRGAAPESGAAGCCPVPAQQPPDRRGCCRSCCRAATGRVGAQQPPSRVVSASASPYVCEDTLGSLSNRNPWQAHQASCRAEWGRRGLRTRNGMRLRMNTLAQLAHSVFEQHGRRLVHDLIYDAGGTSAVLGTRLG